MSIIAILRVSAGLDQLAVLGYTIHLLSLNSEIKSISDLLYLTLDLKK